ncbi:tellurite resistance TerB family protein [Halochromatium glycolicum]|uniref:Tellurite resistance TerB family protein n=1 Tax=Halochromatium glycolicum TaxID=85075 RepID=A0AAJ0U8L0_9GAMM|nr:tellurite resistance TerB family protein [Halochromatium glycolicum]MBK1707339.1 hypothetical protein [Halochromatium glycolicum]
MIDPKRLLDELAGSGAAGGFAGGAAGSVLGSLLTGKSGKKARKFAGSAAKLGGAALVGGLAYKAWQSYQQGQQTAPAGPPATPPVEPPPAGSAFLPAPDESEQNQALSLLLSRAMIAAAKADGQIDVQESQTLLNRINGLDLPAEDKAFLFEEYGRPLDIQGLAAAVDSPEHAAEVYTASLLMVDPPSPPERIYLDSLAQALQLEAGLVAQIQQAVAASRDA